MNLSQNFTLEEFTMSGTASRLGIDNTAPPYMVSILKQTALSLEGVRSMLDEPMNIDSAYRCLALNRAIKSEDTSDHIRGLAVDFIAPRYGDPLSVCQAIRASGMMLRQLINELSWVHIAFSFDGCGAPVIDPHNRFLTIDRLGTREGLWAYR